MYVTSNPSNFPPQDQEFRGCGWCFQKSQNNRTIWGGGEDRWVRHAKKGVPKFFACGGLFFVVEALKTIKNPIKPLKTVNFSKFFPKTIKFLKKGAPKIFRLRRAFFQKSPRSILRKSSVKVGGSKTYFTPPPMTGYACRRSLV